MMPKWIPVYMPWKWADFVGHNRWVVMLQCGHTLRKERGPNWTIPDDLKFRCPDCTEWNHRTRNGDHDRINPNTVPVELR